MATRQQFGAILLAVVLIATGGFTTLTAAKGTMDTSDSSSNAVDDENDVFPEPVEISLGGLTISVGPPADLNDDGAYEDVNADGELTILDAVFHAIVVTAVNADQLDLTSEQATAVDVDENGEVTYEDATELGSQALMTDGGMDVGPEDMPDVSTDTDTDTETDTNSTPASETDTPETTDEETDTATSTPTETPTSENAPPAGAPSSILGDGAGDDLNCEDFESVEEAQWNADNTDDENNLDSDDDGTACENGVDG